MSETPWSAARLLQTSGSYWATCALHAAVELDLFSRLAAQPLTSAALAADLAAPVEGVRRLLAALVAMGLIEKGADGYANAPVSGRHLCRDAPEYLGHIIRHHHHLMPAWSQLDQAVRTGRPLRKRSSREDAEQREAFLMGMFNLASQLAPRLVPAVDLSPCRRLLDLGGGPGTYAIHFCRHNPELRATVFDLATTEPFAEKTIARLGMAARVDFVAGDYLADPLPGGFDAVFLSHILHGEGPAACQRLVAKAFAALNPGGVAVIHEFIVDDDNRGPLFPTLFSLNMLLATEGGRAYRQEELTGMLGAAGFRQIRRLAFAGPNDSGLIQGQRPV